MKKVLLTTLSLLLVLGGGVYVFRAQLWEVAKDTITSDMFISEDTDSFDPGLAIGTRFPKIKAVYLGKEITDIRPFIHDKGMVFIANRSADW